MSKDELDTLSCLYNITMYSWGQEIQMENSLHNGSTCMLPKETRRIQERGKGRHWAWRWPGRKWRDLSWFCPGEAARSLHKPGLLPLLLLLHQVTHCRWWKRTPWREKEKATYFSRSISQTRLGLEGHLREYRNDSESLQADLGSVFSWGPRVSWEHRA